MKQITIKKILILTIILFFSSTALFAGGSKESDVVGGKVTNKKDTTVMNFCKKTSIMFDDITESLCKSVSPFPSVIDNFSIPSNPNSLIDYSLYNTQLKEKERTAWNYTSRMFTLFLTLEIIVLAIKKYLQGNDDLLKEVIIKIVVCFFLIIFLSLTPYILELFKTGLQYSASVVTRSNITYSPTAVFKLPGELIRAQSSLVASISFDNLSSLLTNIDPLKDVTAGYLVSILFNILYAFCRIFAMILVVIMALHIMLNIVEVYLILAVCMCLVPFSVFSITKHLGEKALPCLFNNIMELFIIFLIFYTMTTMLSVLASYDILSTEESAPPIQLVIIPYTTDKDSEGYDKEIAEDWKSFSKKMAGKSNPTFDEVMKGLNETYFKKFLDSKKGKIYARKASPDQTENVSVTKISELRNGDVKLYRDYLITTINLKTVFTVNAKKFLKFTDAIGPGFSSYCFMHIMTYLITLFIVFTFIKRSSQITNSILSGNVSTGGNSALAIAIAMRAAKDVTKAGMGIAGLAGKGGRAGIGWGGDKLRTAKPNSKIASMMQWSAKSSMYNEMKQQEIKRRSQETIAALSGKKKTTP